MKLNNRLFQKVIGYAWIVAFTGFPLLFSYVLATIGSALGATVVSCTSLYGLIWFCEHWSRYWKLRDEHERG